MAPQKQQSQQSNSVPTAYVPYSNRTDLMTAADVARVLRPDLSPERGLNWVKEVVRRRKTHAMPCKNIGKHLVFDWVLISEWIRGCERTVHAPHRRRSARKAAA